MEQKTETERSALRLPQAHVALSDDVGELGALLGEILLEQGGEVFFERVESVRRAAIERREGQAAAGARLAGLCQSLEVDAADDLARAFSAYFRAVNMAEQIHRIRRLIEYQRAGDQPPPEGFEDVLRQLRDAGWRWPQVCELLGRVRVEPVFTAHPTQALRRTILEKQQRMARDLVARMNPALTPEAAHALRESVRAEMTAAWQTEENPVQAPTVNDEIENLLFYVTDVIYRVVPPFYERLNKAAATVYGVEAAQQAPAPVLRFSSWIGGDMDGNPHVSAFTLRAALAQHRRLVLNAYGAELERLYGRLSQSVSRVAVDDAVLERIAAYAQAAPLRRARVARRHRGMPYRVLIRYMRERLQATRRDDEGAYAGPNEFQEDLELIAQSLRRNRGERAGLFWVQRLQKRVLTFGFHLAGLDVRQDALVHREVVARALGDVHWDRREPAQRLRRVVACLEARTPAPRLQGEGDEQTLEVFRAIGDLRARHGEAAVGPYIISMAQGADDVLTVLLLARWAGLVDDDGGVTLDVCPLLETVDDLDRGAEVLESLFGESAYRRHLRGRGDRQLVMVGYSDSMKDGGLAASRWAVQQAQEALVACARRHGVSLTIFHGRGGTASRGSGRTHRGVLAAPPGAVDGRMRVTEQGEIIDAKYGLRGIALRTLEQATGAVALATALPERPYGTRERRSEVMGLIARTSRRAYRELVYEEARFYDYFRQVTPIDVVERMALGSRPSARRKRRGIGDLRAIPWVFSWTQNRTILTGWYGLGTGLAAAVDAFGAEEMASLASGWRFFSNLLDDAEMVLAKSDMDIAARYDELVSPELRDLSQTIRAEHALTVELILRIRGAATLLQQDDTLKRTIALRNPYVDPMSLLQVDLLKRWRDTDREDAGLLNALFTTVRGIALGLQNTG